MPTTPTWLTAALRNQTTYRTVGPEDRSRRWACGFILKPTASHAYADRQINEYAAVYVLRGKGQFVDDLGQSHRVQAGCFLEHHPQRTYSLIQDDDGQWAEVYITFDNNLYQAMRLIGIDIRGPRVLQPGLSPVLLEQFEQIHRDLRQTGDSDLDLLAVRLLELLATAHRLDRRHREDDPQTQMIDQACRLLSRDLGRRRNLPRIAQELGVSYERLRKLFTGKMGLSPGEYRIRRRIDRARELIVQERMSNKQVAYALGYSDPFTFSKQFKAVVGESPTQFRRRMR
jgi:AraC-like DNA-binding protein